MNTNTKTFLHVGCGPKTKSGTTKEFSQETWTELRLDIDPSVSPDIIGSMTNMSSVSDETIDAIYSSHNIEHLYAHEVPTALREFWRVLKPNGYAIITCPDVQAICALVADDKLLEPIYMSAAGPITPMDMLWGWRPAIAAGNTFMSHKTGFTLRVLAAALVNAGFKSIAHARRAAPHLDLWIAASKSDLTQQEIIELAQQHFPL